MHTTARFGFDPSSSVLLMFALAFIRPEVRRARAVVAHGLHGATLAPSEYGCLEISALQAHPAGLHAQEAASASGLLASANALNVVFVQCAQWGLLIKWFCSYTLQWFKLHLKPAFVNIGSTPLSCLLFSGKSRLKIRLPHTEAKGLLRGKKGSKLTFFCMFPGFVGRIFSFLRP